LNLVFSSPSIGSSATSSIAPDVQVAPQSSQVDNEEGVVHTYKVATKEGNNGKDEPFITATSADSGIHIERGK
jgi:hypothetical protein